MPPLHAIARDAIPTLWAIWLGFWIISAFWRKRTIYRQPLPRHLILILVVVWACWFLAMTLMRDPLAPLLPLTPVGDLAGMALCALGMSWSIWARIVLGRNWSGRVSLKENHQLVQSGPYRVTRHPIYTGIISAIVGTVVALAPTMAGAGFLLMTLAAIVVKLRQEEALMLRQFPEAYREYKSRVRTALIPFIW